MCATPTSRRLAAGRCLENIDCAVLAGGLGTRIRDTLGATPKLLAPIAGRPFLDILAARLKAFGARRLVLGLGHLADPIEAQLKAHPLKRFDVVTAVEPEPLGTAGALRFLRPLLKTDPALVLNGDSFVGADLCGFVAAHRRAGTEASLLAVEVADASRYGRLDVASNGLVSGFAEKIKSRPGPGLINAGVYLFSRAALDAIMAMPGKSLERDVFPKMLRQGVNAVVVREAPFVDIGTPDGLEAAAAVLAPFIEP